MLRLLGPLEVMLGDRVIDLGGVRQRIVLAILALNANKVTSIHTLIDAVWDSSPPETSRNQIQICISALRKLFDGTPELTIHTRPPGYMLSVAEGWLDSAQFDRLTADAARDVAAGRTSEAAVALRAALALWRGPVLSDIPSDYVRRSAIPLEERRISALEERLRAELELGQHRLIVGELQMLVAQQPLHEERYRLLMLALYRSGRQAEALEVARQARATLIEEVGVEPGAELRQLEQDILNQAPELQSAPAGREAPSAEEPGLPARRVADVQTMPRQLPPSIGDFTGRERQIEEIKSLLSPDEQPEAAAPFAPRIVGISGRGGVGKSVLAIRVAHELSASSYDAALYAKLGGAVNHENGEVLTRFLRALGASGPSIPENLQERVELYRSKLTGKRTLVLLDDATSEEEVLPFMPGSDACALMVISRSQLSGLPGVHWVDIDVFDIENSLSFLAKIIGPERVAVEDSAAVELIRLCGHLPLALRIAGARLASRRHWSIAELAARLGDESRRLDELTHHGLELRSSIEMAYSALDDTAQRLFRLLAIIDAPDFPGWAVAALLDSSLAEAESLLDCLVDARLLDATPDREARQFRYHVHDLIKVYAREQLLGQEPEGERTAALIRVLGAWLALAEEAHRKEYGGDYTIIHSAAPRWQPPDGGFPHLIGNPMEWLESEHAALVTAVRQAAVAGLDDLSWDLALTAVSLFEAKGSFDDWRVTSQLAYEITERAGNRIGHAAMLYSLGTLHVFQKRLIQAENCFKAAWQIFMENGSNHGQALVLRNWGLVDRLRNDFSAMLGKYGKALELMRLVGDRIGEAHILCSLAKFQIGEAGYDAAEQMLHEALAIIRETPCARVEAQITYRFAELYLESERIELARDSLTRVLLNVRAIGDRIGEAYALYGLGVVRHREGRLDLAQDSLMHALSLARRMGDRVVEGQALCELGKVALAAGNLLEARTRLHESVQIFDELRSPVWYAKARLLLSEIDGRGGDMAAAREEIEKAAGALSAIDSKESRQLLEEVQVLRSGYGTAVRDGAKGEVRAADVPR
jgi:DNA-binding SARP family transcriptional activator